MAELKPGVARGYRNQNGAGLHVRRRLEKLDRFTPIAVSALIQSRNIVTRPGAG
jgi:hypothetical protein